MQKDIGQKQIDGINDTSDSNNYTEDAKSKASFHAGATVTQDLLSKDDNINTEASSVNWRELINGVQRQADQLYLEFDSNIKLSTKRNKTDEELSQFYGYCAKIEGIEDLEKMYEIEALREESKKNGEYTYIEHSMNSEEIKKSPFVLSAILYESRRRNFLRNASDEDKKAIDDYEGSAKDYLRSLSDIKKFEKESDYMDTGMKQSEIMWLDGQRRSRHNKMIEDLNRINRLSNDKYKLKPFTYRDVIALDPNSREVSQNIRNRASNDRRMAAFYAFMIYCSKLDWVTQLDFDP